MENLLKNKVMIVDDDQTIVLPIEMNLQERGVNTISFNDGEEALEYLKSNKVSVILLDYHMEPHINGDEFIKRLREFDKETIIYLQTAYSEELPAIDMLEKYQIQGYIDKGKEILERMQLIISALKQAETMELVKEQQRQIEAHTYKENFLGKFFETFLGEVKEKSFLESTNIAVLEEFASYLPEEKKGEYSKYLNYIKEAITYIENTLNTLEINEEVLTAGKLRDIIVNLFKTICSFKKVSLNINIEKDYQVLNCNSKNIIYIITEIVDYLISHNESEITINFKIKDDEVVDIEVENDIDDNELENLNKLAMLDENIEIEKNDRVVIVIK